MATWVPPALLLPTSGYGAEGWSCFPVAQCSAWRHDRGGMVLGDGQRSSPPAPCWGGRCLPGRAGMLLVRMQQALGLPGGWALLLEAARLLPALPKGCGSAAPAGPLCFWPRIFSCVWIKHCVALEGFHGRKLRKPVNYFQWSRFS